MMHLLLRISDPIPTRALSYMAAGRQRFPSAIVSLVSVRLHGSTPEALKLLHDEWVWSLKTQLCTLPLVFLRQPFPAHPFSFCVTRKWMSGVLVCRVKDQVKKSIGTYHDLCPA